MTRRELNLAIFEGKAAAVLWQPILATWINHHRDNGTLPAALRDADDLAIYDYFGCAIRYGANSGETVLAPSAGIERHEGPEVSRETRRQGNYLIETVRTPRGELRTVHQDVWRNGRLQNRRIVEFPVKTREQLLILRDYVERLTFRANLRAFLDASEQLGIRCEPAVFLQTSGFTDLIKWHCGLVDAYYLLADHPAEVEAYLGACDRRDDRMLAAALQLPCRIFSFSDHATNEFTPPPILKRYMIPRWQRLSERLHAAGRFIHAHWDGNSKTILPYLRETGLDGVEALPPLPMGDITLEEVKAAVGDRLVCLDLLPAIHFLDHYSLSETLEFTRRVIDMFAPRLILGVSDELPANGNIRKIEAISELLRAVCGLAD